MNKKVIAVMVLALAAMAVLYLYSFGPLAGRRQAVRMNPRSLEPSTQGGVGGQQVYHNKDSKENHYRISLPADWRVQAGTTPGSYSFTFADGAGSVELMDVPDNSTLELFILSREEPGLKRKVPGYERKEYRKAPLHGHEAYILRYGGVFDGRRSETMRTYISGQDMTGVVTFTVPAEKAATIPGTLAGVSSGFEWEDL